MIESIQLVHFKSYYDARLQLASLTLLIGANASGKTNCIEALRFLSQLASGQRISDILEDSRQADLTIRGKTQNIVFDGFAEGRKTNKIAFLIMLARPARWRCLHTTLVMQTPPKESWVYGDEVREDYAVFGPVLYESDFNSPERHEVKVEYEDFSGKSSRSVTYCSNRQAVFTQLDVPSRFATKEAQEIIPAVVTEFQQALRNIIFLDLNPRAMVDYSFIVDNTLKSDGRNLSSVLFDICETQGRKAEVLEFIGNLPEQQISDVTFLKGPRGEVMVELTETFGHTPVRREAPLLSDGTLRVLAVAAALLSAPVGGLVVIEEIDNGVHPSRAKALLATILAASKRRSLRVLLTSHNPALLDTLPKESVPDVVCCYRDPEQGDSRLVRLADLTDYPDLVARGPLGQLMTQGLLDRYLKNQRTPEEKAAQAQEWLRQLQLEDEEDAA